MRRLSFIIFALSFSATLLAKDIKTAVFSTYPEMHCENCEKKIKGSLRFEKGIKNIIRGFKKIKYEAKEVKKDTADKQKSEKK